MVMGTFHWTINNEEIVTNNMKTNIGIETKYLVLLSCCSLSIATIGLSANSFAVFLPHIASYFEVGIGKISIIMTIVGVSTGLFNPIALKLTNVVTLKKTVAFCMNVEILCYYFFSSTNSLIIIYIVAAIIGICNAFAGSVMISYVLARWFADNPGTATGLALGLSGLAGAIFNPLFNKLIETIGWQKAILLLGLGVFLFSLPSSFSLSLPLTNEHTVFVVDTNEEIEKPLEVNSSRKNHYSRLFLVLLSFAIFLIGSLPGLCSHYVNLSLNIGLSTSFGAKLVAMAFLGNMFSKFILGYLIDRFGVKQVSTIVYSLISTGLFLFLVTNGNKVLLLISAFVVGLSYASCGIIFSLMSKEVFGMSNYVHCYGILSMLSYLGSSISAGIIGFSFDYYNCYNPAITLCLIFVVITVAVIRFVYRNKDKNTLVNCF